MVHDLDMKLAVPIIGLIAFVGFRYGLLENYRRVAAAITGPGPSSCITLVGSTTSEEHGATYIVGSIRNHCRIAISHAAIAFRVDRTSDSNYRSDAPVIAYAHDIPAGGTKSFKLQIWRDRNFSYRFDSITAF